MAIGNGQRTLPELVRLRSDEANRMPSPGTMRLLKAQTGRDWADFMNPESDSADRFQTLIWVKLRRDIPDLTWAECEDVGLIIEDVGSSRPDPTPAANAPVSTTSRSSADSGG